MDAVLKSNDCLKWHTATWSKKVFPSSVHRFGTDEDKLANFKNGVYTPQRIVRDVGFERNRKRKKETVIRRRDYTGSRRPTCKSTEGLMESVPSGKKMKTTKTVLRIHNLQMKIHIVEMF